jgi:hypothetical protein
MNGDTASMVRVQRRADSAATFAREAAARSYAKRLGSAARAYLALARGDTVGAIAGLAVLPDTACPICFFDRYQLTDLLVKSGRAREASMLLRKEVADPVEVLNNPMFLMWHLQHARAARILREREQARRYYRTVEAVWRNADSEVQGFVREARGYLRDPNP